MAPGALWCCSGASPEAADPERLPAAAAAAAPAPAPARGPYTSVSTPPSPRSPNSSHPPGAGDPRRSFFSCGGTVHVLPSCG